MTLLIASASISFYQNISSCVSYEERHTAVSPMKENHSVTRTLHLPDRYERKTICIKALQTYIEYTLQGGIYFM